jgi:iron complex transport system substrate-binding protein
MSQPSVVTLLPAATEIVYSLGIEPDATSHACDFPPTARDLPTACHSTISGTTSEEINTSVETTTTQQNGGYRLHRSVINQIDPDIVITQGICDVCAIDQSTVTRALQTLDCSPEIVSCHPHTFEDILDTIHAIGAALNSESAAKDVVASIRDRVQAITDAVPQSSPSIAVLDWMDPIMLAGHWVPNMVELAGGTSAIHPPTRASGPIPWNDLLVHDPDKLLVAPCGYSLAQTTQNITELTDRPEWHSLSAVQNDHVYFINGNDYINRPGPRIIDSLEILAHILHPSHISPPPDCTIRSHSAITAATNATQ